MFVVSAPMRFCELQKSRHMAPAATGAAAKQVVAMPY